MKTITELLAPIEERLANSNVQPIIFHAKAPTYIAKLIAALKRAEEALVQIRKHCTCTRNTLGFDYGENHEILGKPKVGARWLVPHDISVKAQADIAAIFEEAE